MTNEEKIDATYISVLQLMPQVTSILERLSGIDTGIRSMELHIEAHEVKISRLISDVDGLGRKFRYQEDKDRIRSAGGGGRDGSKWLTILEFLAIAPKYGSWILVILMFFLGIIGMLVRFTAKLPVPKIPITTEDH